MKAKLNENEKVAHSQPGGAAVLEAADGVKTEAQALAVCSRGSDER
jgi:hypothetical protein